LEPNTSGMNRKIEIGDVISKVFQTYREYAGVLLPVAAVLFLVEALLSLAGRDNVGLAFVATIVGLVLNTLYTGMVVELVNDVRDGRLDQSVGGLFRSVGPVVAPLIVVSILAGIGIAIGFVLLIIPGLLLLTFWAVVAPVTVLERPGIFAAFGRSIQLVKGNAGPVFGVIVLFFVIFIAIGIALAAIGAGLGDVGRVIFDWISRIITAPLVALAAAILYFELKRVDGEAAPPATEVTP
jgi:hypothetical protein